MLRIRVRVLEFGYSSGVPLYRVQIELNMDSANERDRCVNTWHLIADDELELESGGIVALTTFYGGLASYLSASVNPTASVYRAYDLADPEPRAPVLEEQFDVGTTGTTVAPPELAIVCSFEAPQQSGQPQARRRGRIYFGPLYMGVIDSATGTVQNAVVDVIAAELQELLDTSQAATTWAWSVYSRVNASAIEVQHAWVDDAFDIQRRRGTSAQYTVDAT